MPRARITTATDDETIIKKPRATRTRAVSSDGEEKPSPRRRRVVESASESVVDSATHDTTRKAPTALGDHHRKQTRNSRGLMYVSVFCSVVVAFSVGVGILDRGVIDVVAVVNERNEKINRGEVRDASGQQITQTVNVQAPETRPNGGLILADVQPSAVPVPVPVETATSTATSTEVVSGVPATTTATSSASE